MKLHCDVIRDLLPLYLDGVCSEESKKMVENHLCECGSCKGELEELREKLLPTSSQSREVNITHAAAVAWNKRKHRSFLKGTAITMAVILLLTVMFILPNTRVGMVSTVQIWESQLNDFAQEQLALQVRTQFNVFGYKVDVVPDAKYVLFWKPGIPQYSGFYYSADGVPVGFQGTAVDFEEWGNGWYWREINGDNWMYTEHIIGNWFWVESSY